MVERSLNLTSSYPVKSLSGNQKLHLQRDATHNDGGRIRRTTTSIVRIDSSTSPKLNFGLVKRQNMTFKCLSAT